MSDLGKLVPYVKRKWVKALRSGEYKQGVGVLKRRSIDRYAYCCIGVIAEEMAPAAFDAEPSPTPSGIVWVEGRSKSYLPDDLACLWGLTFGAQEKLGRMNDSGEPFPVIADWIEANL